MAEPAYAEKNIIIPERCVDLQIPGIRAPIRGGRVQIKPYEIQFFGYPTDSKGNFITDKTQEQAVEFLNTYNREHGTNFRLPSLAEDWQLRRKHGRHETNEKGHWIFDPNFQRNGEPWTSGYVSDFSLPCKKSETIEGVDGQRLIPRRWFWRTQNGNEEIGIVYLAQEEGMVPEFRRDSFEKKYGAKALKTLKSLGVRIPDSLKGNLIPVTDLGIAVFTLDHEAVNENGKLHPHAYHHYPPLQEQGEVVGIRCADWRHRGDHGCFRVYLGIDAGNSRPHRSFPLVREGGVVVKRKIENEFEI